MNIYIQQDSKDCGPVCLMNIAGFYGKSYPMHLLREYCNMTKEGVSLKGLASAANRMGFVTTTAKIDMRQLKYEIKLPCILLFGNNHFVVFYKISQNKRCFKLIDPALGKISYSEKEMAERWALLPSEAQWHGIAMQLEPSGAWDPNVQNSEEQVRVVKTFLSYIYPHKMALLLILLGTIVTMCLSFVMPLLSQVMVDVGVLGKHVDLIGCILIAQIIIVVSQMAISIFQGWITLHANMVINTRLISDYLGKLSLVSARFFDIKTRGDVLQRIGDHGRIKNFMLNDMISIFFAIGTFAVFSVIMIVYSPTIFVVLLLGSTLMMLWVFSFLHVRKVLDNRKFEKSTQVQNNTIQYVEGINDIKYNNVEKPLRWKWERLQVQMYHLNAESLRLYQIQSIGSSFIVNLTNVTISFICAKMVVDNVMTMGMMMSLSFIIGQLYGPISSFVSFATNYQDAKISMGRLCDINSYIGKTSRKECRKIDEGSSLLLQKATFSYNGDMKHNAIEKLTLRIPYGETTMIVGKSGCGKTTLIKLLQGQYYPQMGDIFIGNDRLRDVDDEIWRSNTGTLAQEGFIFSDTILNNIVLWDNDINQEKLNMALDISNLKDVLEDLPVKLHTIIGKDGICLSKGQKQRVLVARLAYKSPDYIFLDEATSSLDMFNENDIMEKMFRRFKGKTVVFVTHHLNNMKFADNVVVMSKGHVVSNFQPAKVELEEAIMKVRDLLNLEDNDKYQS